MQDLETQNVLGWMIWGEAEGESLEGQVAVAQVATNRLKLATRHVRPVIWWGWTLKTILEHPYQFQGLWRVKLHGKTTNDPCPPHYFQIAGLEMADLFKPIVPGATHFITVDQDIFKDKAEYAFVKRVGRHTFYQEAY